MCDTVAQNSGASSTGNHVTTTLHSTTPNKTTRPTQAKRLCARTHAIARCSLVKRTGRAKWLEGRARASLSATISPLADTRTMGWMQHGVLSTSRARNVLDRFAFNWIHFSDDATAVAVSDRDQPESILHIYLQNLTHSVVRQKGHVKDRGAISAAHGDPGTIVCSSSQLGSGEHGRTQNGKAGSTTRVCV